jgi:hypothetical protein
MDENSIAYSGSNYEDASSNIGFDDKSAKQELNNWLLSGP